jgi:hypothetical protein
MKPEMGGIAFPGLTGHQTFREKAVKLVILE